MIEHYELIYANYCTGAEKYDIDIERLNLMGSLSPIFSTTKPWTHEYSKNMYTWKVYKQVIDDFDTGLGFFIVFLGVADKVMLIVPIDIKSLFYE
jgi:hypothetical protein